MSRNRRPYLPGVAFHITARTIGHEPWFSDSLCERIIGFMNTALGRTDTRMLAYAVMPSHLHLVVHQRTAPLAQLLQPFLRQCALLVQRAMQREGYIFERRYRAKPCFDADYLRDAIAYVHRNPVDAGLCCEPAHYRWSSHAYYCSPAPRREPHAQVEALCELFAASEHEAAIDRSAGYLRYYAWRNQCAHLRDGVPPPHRPIVTFGNTFWARDFVSLPREPLRRPDLRDIVLRALLELAPSLDLDTLRLRRGGRTITAIRREVIRRAVLSGHRGVDIARILNVSETTVSKVATVVLDRAPVRYGAQHMHHMGIGQKP